jgi:hypothetical protein
MNGEEFFWVVRKFTPYRGCDIAPRQPRPGRFARSAGGHRPCLGADCHEEVAHVKQTLMSCVVVPVVLMGAASASAQSSAADGEKLFAAQKCTICHSVAGQGNKKGPLDGVSAQLSADDIRLWITNAPDMAAKAKAERKPAMKAYSSLSKAEVDALVAFVQSLKK